jgi:hypothetical protein
MHVMVGIFDPGFLPFSITSMPIHAYGLVLAPLHGRRLDFRVDCQLHATQQLLE